MFGKIDMFVMFDGWNILVFVVGSVCKHWNSVICSDLVLKFVSFMKTWNGDLFIVFG